MDITPPGSGTQWGSVADWLAVVATFIGAGITFYGVKIAKRALGNWRTQVHTERKWDAIIATLCALDAVEQSVGTFRLGRVTFGEQSDFGFASLIPAPDDEQGSESHHKDTSNASRELVKSMWLDRGKKMGERREQLVSKVLLCVHAEYVAQPADLEKCLSKMNELLDSLSYYARVQLEGHLWPNSFESPLEREHLKVAEIELNNRLDSVPIDWFPNNKRWNCRWQAEANRVRQVMKEAIKECRGGVAPI